MIYFKDCNLARKYPNKYNLTPENIKNLKILDWDRLKEHTWYNTAMQDSGKWWCHLEGCTLNGKYDDFTEFWIGFNEDTNEINCSFSTWHGMCNYKFDEFYEQVENKFDFYTQVNAIKYINKLIDNGILGL